MDKGQLKQRKKNPKKDKGQPKSKQATTDTANKKKKSPASAKESNKEKTLSQVFFSHPLVVVAPWILIPYGLYMAYNYVTLQRPDLLAPFGIHLRPAVAIHEMRQVLVVGSMSSGTVQVANDLSALLRLEIGHESSDSQSEFVRDGTVSWFHVIRYLEPPSRGQDAILAYTNLCRSFTPVMGFHPAMYRRTAGCSPRSKWDACWKRECFAIVLQEWGCALPNATTTGRSPCETPFAKTLHQIRHPLRTIESLVVKFCQGSELDTGVVSPGFFKFAEALFGRAHNFTDDSCVEAAAHYVLEYNRAMLAARSSSLLAGTFRIEETSACQLAELAGFIGNDSDKALYPPSAARVEQICSNKEHPARKIMTSTKHKRNTKVIELDFVDFRGGTLGSKRPASDTTLEQALKDLTTTLGYNVTFE